MNEFISIKVIIDRLLRHPLLQDLTFEAAIDYTIDFMRIVGVPKMFEQKIETVKIENYRGQLSGNVYKIMSIQHNGTPLKYSGEPMHFVETVQSETPNVVSEINVPHINTKILQYLKTFELKSSMKTYYETNSDNAETYTIQGNVIFTSIKNGELQVYYLNIKTDEEGYPMIQDNSSYLRALELYIKKQWFTILFDLGKLQLPILQNTQQEYAWAVGDCESEYHRFNLDQAEEFFKQMNAAVLSKNNKYGFKILEVKK